MQEVCNSYKLGHKHGLDSIADFDTIDHVSKKDGVRYPLFINTDLEFDDESIMFYSSSLFMNPAGDSTDVMQVPMTFWKLRGMGFTPPAHPTRDDLGLIPVNWKVSRGDYEGIEYLYPW